MKKRTDFVSNSSSSSFIVPNWKKAKDVTFEEFSAFIKSLFKEDYVKSKQFGWNIRLVDKNKYSSDHAYKSVLGRNMSWGVDLKFLNEFLIDEKGEVTQFHKVWRPIYTLLMRCDLPGRCNFEIADKVRDIFEKYEQKYCLTYRDACLSPSCRFVIIVGENTDAFEHVSDEFTKLAKRYFKGYKGGASYGTFVKLVYKKYGISTKVLYQAVHLG